MITVFFCTSLSSCIFLNPQRSYISFFFFFNDTATTEIYTLSLHDALPILLKVYESLAWLWSRASGCLCFKVHGSVLTVLPGDQDRKSTRLNSSHGYISYAVFCLKKKKRMYD